MNLHDEIEIVRGKTVPLRRNVAEIPCEEHSSPLLCRAPVVSVEMLAYNHEKYIARAIESIMSQRTDFEVELLIGEDCSTDRTRQICLEYLKRFPTKIRLLCSEQNVGIHENIARISSRCRGEFIAICEGDDYWTDPDKLQKQVGLMRRYPDVGLCFAGANIIYEDTGVIQVWNAERRILPGKIHGMHFFLWHLFGTDVTNGTEGDPATFLMTASVLMRKSVVDEAKSRYGIFNWKLSLADTTTWLGLSSLADVYYLEDSVSVYYRNSASALGTVGMRVGMDADLVRAYYALKRLHVPFDTLPSKFRTDMLLRIVRFQLAGCSRFARMRYFTRIGRLQHFGALVRSCWAWPIVVVGIMMKIDRKILPWLVRIYLYLLPRHTSPAWFEGKC